MSYLKRLTNAALGRLQAFRMYGGIGMSDMQGIFCSNRGTFSLHGQQQHGCNHQHLPSVQHASDHL